MSNLQKIILGLAVFLFLGLYFGTSTKTPDQEKVERTRALSAESTDINGLLIDAKPELSDEQATYILSLEKSLETASSDANKQVEALKNISGKWYEYSRADIAGHYAKEVALIDSTEMSWSITGTTYMLGARQTTKEKIKSYCVKEAISAFENAISINPDNTSHQLNLATCYAENPPEENPMKGILMLLDLNKKNPDNVSVLISLAKFGMQTGQNEKAIGRLKKAIDLDPEARIAYCMLAKAYEATKNATEASFYQQECDKRAKQ